MSNTITRSQFIQNLKDNIKYIEENHPEYLDIYRVGVRAVSLDVINSCSDDIEEDYYKMEFTNANRI